MPPSDFVAPQSEAERLEKQKAEEKEKKREAKAREKAARAQAAQTAAPPQQQQKYENHTTLCFVNSDATVNNPII